MLSLGLSLLGIGKNLLSWLTAGVKWIFADIHRIAIAVLLGVAVWLYVGKQAETLRADKMTTVAAKWESAYVLVIEAQRLATIAAEKNKARVIEEYRKVNEYAEKDYALRLADSRSALERWKLQNRRGATCQGNSTTSTDLPPGPLPETAQTEFLVRSEDLDIAAENYAQLVSLIAWAEKIGDVNTEEVIIP